MSEISELNGVMNREELLNQVADYEAAEPLEMELGDGIEFEVAQDGTISIAHDKGKTSLSPGTVDQLSAHIGFPRSYLKKIPPEQLRDLVLPHLNFWYQQKLAGDTLRLLTIDNNAITAIPKANFEHVKVSQVVDAVEHALGKSIAGYHKPWFGPTSFQFSALTPREVEVTKDHIYNSGIRVEHSVTGETSTRISPYLFNQWCTNGATTEHKLDTWTRKNHKEDVGAWMSRMIVESSKCFDKEIDNLKELCGIKVDENTSAVLDSVLKQSSVPARLQKEVRNTLIDDGTDTLYDIYLGLTKVDTHSDVFKDNPGGKGVLDRVAAHLAHHSRLCPVCHKHMNGS